MTTIFSIGFGDIKPKNDAEKAVCIMIMAFGVFFFTYFISSINLILNLRSKKSSLLSHDLRVLQNIKNKYKVPADLYKKIQKHLKYSHNNIEKDHKTFALSLSSRISQQLIFTMNKKLVEDNVFFSDKPENFIREIVLHLKPVKLDFGEVVCTKGEVAQEIYFVTEGKVSYFIMNEDYETVEAGDFFGDAELFHLEYREFNVKANEPSELFSLDHVILLNCLKFNEDAKASVVIIAIEKYKILKRKEHAAGYKKRFYARELDKDDENISYKIDDSSSKKEDPIQMDMYIENIETS
jgi:CRP-like cAMP-binding protein